MTTYQREVCPHCGGLYTYMKRHLAWCTTLPLPDELRAEQQQTGVTTNALAEKYRAHFYAMKRRLEVVSGEHDYGLNRCRSCGINLLHPAVPDAGDLCGWCAADAERPKRARARLEREVV